MRVLLTGAYGLIGSAVLARLHRDGHELIAAGRSIGEAQRRLPYARWIATDFRRLTTAADWKPFLAGIDAVVNCVGVLQDGGRDDVQAVQVDGTCALFDACAEAGVRRVVHISAIGAAREGPTAFVRTKAQAEAHLATLDLDWVVLRPSVVLSPAAYGGSAMLRGLAGLPWLTPAVAGAVQVVSVDDIADTVAICLRAEGLRADAPAKKAVWEVTHPAVHELAEIVAALRAWHGFPPLPRLPIPAASLGVVAMFAEFAGLLGWRSPARANALMQLVVRTVGDPTSWIAATGIQPKSLTDILAQLPASVQDRWFARLYWLKPLAILALAAFWITTGVVALGPGRAAGIDSLTKAGFSPNIAELMLLAGSLLDVALGFAVCVRRFARRALQMMLVVALVYLAVGAITMPAFWLDPLGPYTKIIPVLLATLFTLAIIDER